MDKLPPPPPPPPPGRGRGSKRPDDAPERSHGDRSSSNKKSANEFNADGTPATGGRGPGSWPRWTIWVLVGVLAAAFLVPTLWPSDSGTSLEYSEWRTQLIEGNIDTAEINTGSGNITGEFTNGDKYSTTGVAEPVSPKPTAPHGRAERRVQLMSRRATTGCSGCCRSSCR